MGARHGTLNAKTSNPRVLNVEFRKSCSTPLLLFRQIEIGDLEGVSAVRHPLTQGQRSSHLLRFSLEMGLLVRSSDVVHGSVVPHHYWIIKGEGPTWKGSNGQVPWVLLFLTNFNSRPKFLVDV